MEAAGSSLSHLSAGACAGMCATALLHPLDLIKTRLHVQDDVSSIRRLPRYGGLYDAFLSIVRLEGWLGLYQGLLPNIVGNTASWGVYMYAYDRCKRALAQRTQLEGSALYVVAATVAGVAMGRAASGAEVKTSNCQTWAEGRRSASERRAVREALSWRMRWTCRRATE